MCLTATARLLENELGESVNARTASLNTFKELGPPDLVHLSKTSTKTQKVSGTYHYVTGVDTSSSAAVAAYLNTLTFTLGEEQIWFGKHPQWKVHTGVFCSYNAFSRNDVRVMVKIPGSVEAYVVDERGDKRPATDQAWTETYLSAMLRALLFADDENYYFISFWRRLNPLSTPAMALRFFEAFESLFFQGPSLGSVAEVQVPTIVSNYLVDGFLKFVKVTGMYEQAVAVLGRLAKFDSDILAITARVLLQNNEEVRAVQVMGNGVTANPRDFNLLELQADYCTGKDKLEWALDCAIRAVNSAPAEFLPWARLVQIYTKMGNYEQALLTLNSCPMSTSRELDLPKLPPPAKGHFPLPSDGVLEEVWANPGNGVPGSDDQNVADPGLLKLPAPTLRSTFAKAYELLTDIVGHIGWDALLNFRSNVFVMEEEYCKETKVARGHSVGTLRSEPNGGEITKPEAGPTTKDTGDDDVRLSSTELNNGNASETLKSKEDKAQEDEEEADKMKSKRLCERWLDNLFMVLYEDLRVYTVWRAEYVHYQSQQMPYHKTALEWEVLGMVALRLRHEDEAADAFLHSLELKFSHRVLWKLLEHYEHRSDNSSILDAVVKLTAWNHRWYNEFSPKLITALRNLVAAEGVTKVASKVEAKYSPEGVVDLLEMAFKQLTTFNAVGSDS